MGLRIVVLLAVCSLALQAAAPKGWFVAGSKPTEYESVSTQWQHTTVIQVPI